jgi:hypothetical protein
MTRSEIGKSTDDLQCTGFIKCSKCGLSKPAIAFAANPSTASGLFSYCRDCVREYDRERRVRNKIGGRR